MANKIVDTLQNLNDHTHTPQLSGEEKTKMNITGIHVDGLNDQRTRAAAGWQDGEARYHFWFDLKTRTIEGLHFTDGKPTIYKNSLVTESREPGYFNTRYIDATKKKNVAIIAAVWDEINAKELIGKAIIEQDAVDLKRKQEIDAHALQCRKQDAGERLFDALSAILEHGEPVLHPKWIDTSAGQDCLKALRDAKKLIAEFA